MRLEEKIALPQQKISSVLCFHQLLLSKGTGISKGYGFGVRDVLQVWTKYKHMEKFRVHICSMEAFSFLASKYFWRFCPHLALSECLVIWVLTQSLLKKILWNIFWSGYPALLEQKYLMETSVPVIFLSGKFLSVLKQKVMSAGWKARAKRRDLNQKSKPSDEKNINSAEYHFAKSSKTCKMSQEWSCP